MLLLDANATAARLPWDRLVPAIAEVMRARRDGRLQAPARSVLPLPDDGRWLAMPAADDRLAICKLVSVTPANRALGRATVQGLVVVADARSGEPLALLDGPTLTARRTAAVTLLG